MSKYELYENLTNDKLEISNFPKKENYEQDENERVSNTSFHSLEFSPTGEYNTLNEPIWISLVSSNIYLNFN